MPLFAAESVYFEGYLREIPEGYVLFPVVPERVELPNGICCRLPFVLLELDVNHLSSVGKYVEVRGCWSKMWSPLFNKIAILKVDMISDNHWTNTDYLSEEAHDFFDAHMPIIAIGMCSVARWQALKGGFSILEILDGCLVEIRPDGTTKLIERLVPTIPMK